MAESQYAKDVQTVAESVRGLDGAAQVAAVAGVVGEPDDKTRKIVWIVFVGGMVTLLIIALGGLIYLLSESKETDILLTVFTAVLTGLVGLFAPSPVKGGNTGG